MPNCFIWPSANAEHTPEGGRGRNMLAKSERAGGQYIVTDSVVPQLRGLKDAQRVLVTDFVVEQNRLGSIPQISTMSLPGILSRREAKMEARTLGMLRYLKKLTGGVLGRVVKFYDNSQFLPAFEGMLANTSSTTKEEFASLIAHGEAEGWLERPVATAKALFGVQMKPAGLMQLERFENVNSGSEQGFIAMWFNSSMDEALFKGFEAGVRDAGYRPLRIDRKETIEKIDDEIIAEIRRSRFLVADFTAEPNKPRGGVYYEAGFARGLGLPVISTCMEDRIEFVHFDTRQFNHLLWKDVALLRTALANRIAAVVGYGPLKVGS